MKAKLVLFVITIFFMTAASARIWRVNKLSNYNGTSQWGSNFGGTQVYPVFSELKQPNDSSFVLPGDTIHLEGTAGSYNTTVPITKKVTIIGPGYLLNENPQASYSGLSAKISGYIHFDPGSEGSQIIGVHISGSFRIATNNIAIKRCLFDGAIEITGINGSVVLTDILIAQNFFSNPNRSFSGNAILFSSIGTQISDIRFNNNICERRMEMPDYFWFSECKNNFFDYGTITNINNNPVVKMNVGLFQNNILNAPGGTVNINNGTNNNVSYNVSSSTSGQFGISDQNVFVADITTVFVDRNINTADGDYQLRASWTTIPQNNGADGTERGVFGGAITNRYTLSGLAPIPVIYLLQTSGVSGSGSLPVKINARIIN